MRILAIETASPPGSIAVVNDQERCFRQLESAQKTTESFAIAIQDALNEANCRPTDIDLVASTTGPGSFTGLRIGITAAKVFAYATQSRVWGVNTLSLIAWQCGVPGNVEVIFDAQRGELFAARFEKQQDVVKELEPTRVISADEWISERSHDATLSGPGLAKIVDRLPPTSVIAPQSAWEPRADELARLAESMSVGKTSSDPMSLTPYYFRKSAAEEKADRRRSSQ